MKKQTLGILSLIYSVISFIVGLMYGFGAALKGSPEAGIEASRFDLLPQLLLNLCSILLICIPIGFVVSLIGNIGLLLNKKWDIKTSLAGIVIILCGYVSIFATGFIVDWGTKGSSHFSLTVDMIGVFVIIFGFGGFLIKQFLEELGKG